MTAAVGIDVKSRPGRQFKHFLLVAIAALTIAGSTAGAQTITPRFAWPANSAATIVGTGALVTVRDGARDSSAMPMTSSIQVKSHPLGVRILTGPTQSGIGSIPIRAAFSATLEKLVAAYVVSSQGVFVLLEDTLQVQLATRALLEPTLQTRYVGVVACPSSSDAKICWRFESHTDADVESMRSAMKQMIHNMGVPENMIPANVPVPTTITTGHHIFDAATSRPLEMGMTVETGTNSSIPGIPGETRITSTMRATYNWHSM